MIRLLKNITLIAFVIYLTACASTSDYSESSTSAKRETTTPAHVDATTPRCNRDNDTPIEADCKNGKTLGDPDTLD